MEELEVLRKDREVLITRCEKHIAEEQVIVQEAARIKKQQSEIEQRIAQLGSR